jgi:hypothetical protein
MMVGAPSRAGSPDLLGWVPGARSRSLTERTTALGHLSLGFGHSRDYSRTCSRIIRAIGRMAAGLGVAYSTNPSQEVRLIGRSAVDCTWQRWLRGQGQRPQWRCPNRHSTGPGPRGPLSVAQTSPPRTSPSFASGEPASIAETLSLEAAADENPWGVAPARTRFQQPPERPEVAGPADAGRHGPAQQGPVPWRGRGRSCRARSCEWAPAAVATEPAGSCFNRSSTHPEFP